MTPAHQLRKELAESLRGLLQDLRCSQAEAATALQTTQPRISNLYRGRVDGISVEQLVEWLAKLGHSVQITITPSEEAQRTDERYQWLAAGLAALEAGSLWGANAYATRLLFDYPNFRAGGALKYDVYMAFGYTVDASAYRDDKEAVEAEGGYGVFCQYA